MLAGARGHMHRNQAGYAWTERRLPSSVAEGPPGLPVHSASSEPVLRRRVAAGALLAEDRPGTLESPFNSRCLCKEPIAHAIFHDPGVH